MKTFHFLISSFDQRSLESALASMYRQLADAETELRFTVLKTTKVENLNFALDKTHLDEFNCEVEVTSSAYHIRRNLDRIVFPSLVYVIRAYSSEER